MNIKIENLTIENAGNGVNINITKDNVMAQGVLVADFGTVCCEKELMTNLDCLSWEEINEIAKHGDAERTFALGATKKVTLTNGEEMTFRIIGFNHDNTEDCEKAAITWDSTVLMDNEHKMNDEWTNKGGWEKSKMREWLNKDIFDRLPINLRNIIKSVIKTTSEGSRSEKLVNTVDKIFLLSERELFGRNIYSVGKEGNWYDYYRQEDVCWGKKHKNGNTNWAWLRSPSARHDSDFCVVHSVGDSVDYGAYFERGVSLGFCI